MPQSSNVRNFKAHAAVICSNLFLACNYNLVKTISPAFIGPFALNVLRVGVSLALFWTIWCFSGTRAGFAKKDWLRFILCALTGVVINQLLFIKGLTLTSTIHASLLILVTPLIVTFLAFWILKERFTIHVAIGLALGVSGALFLILQRETSNTATNYLLGDILVIINAIAYSLYFILVKPLMARYTPMHIMQWMFTIGFFFMLPVGWQQTTGINTDLFQGAHLIALAFICIVGTFVAYYFNIYGIQHLGASVTGTYIYTQPVFAVSIAIIFLNEEINWQKIVAALLIFAGVFLVNIKRSKG